MMRLALALGAIPWFLVVFTAPWQVWPKGNTVPTNPVFVPIAKRADRLVQQPALASSHPQGEGLVQGEASASPLDKTSPEPLLKPPANTGKRPQSSAIIRKLPLDVCARHNLHKIASGRSWHCGRR